MSTLKAVPPVRLTDLVAAEVRAEMGRQQVTQVTLARRIGMSQQSLSERLRGKTPFTTDDLEKVSGALGVHPAVLLGGIGGSSPSPTGPFTGAYPVKSNTPSDASSTNLRVLSGSRGGPGVMRTARTAA